MKSEERGGTGSEKRRVKREERREGGTAFLKLEIMEKRGFNLELPLKMWYNIEWNF